jgi:hypothetical protein
MIFILAWLGCGFIYLFMFIKRDEEIKELYKSDGLSPLLYGAASILLGPLILLIPLWINKK